LKISPMFFLSIFFFFFPSG